MKNLFKKFTVLAVLTFIVAMLATGCGSADQSAKGNSESVQKAGSTLEKAKSKGVLVIGSSNDAPFAYMDAANNKFSGLDAAIITEVCKRLGINKVEMKQIPFENLLIELNNGTIDMVTDAMYIKQERLEKALFTDVWYKEGEAVVVKADSPIKTKEDLKDKVVGGQKGTAFLEVAQKWLDAGKIKELKIFSNQSELMTGVNTGKIDACVTDGIVAAYTIKQNSSLGLRILTPYDAEAAGKIGAALRFDDKAMLDEVNKTINEMKKDGTLMKILQDYGLNEDYFVSLDEGKTKNIK
ncbi:MAG: ABC transporter substrate-binding protein [Pelosinus sp.]|nr:ABC transporter substrate-binding protein [Pelosinus sp.]